MTTIATVFYDWNSTVRSGMVLVTSMLNRSRHSSRFDLSARILLAALLFGSYIPVGFMPADGAPFRVELCPAAAPLPMPLHQHHHHSASHVHFENCPFGSAPASGPAFHVIALNAPSRISSFVRIPTTPVVLSTQPSRTYEPRGPPALA